MAKRTVAIRFSESEYAALMSLKHKLETSSGNAISLAEICREATLTKIAVYTTEQ